MSFSLFNTAQAIAYDGDGNVSSNYKGLRIMSFSEASGTITQTGTDTNLSGLTGVTGVTVVDNGSHKTYSP